MSVEVMEEVKVSSGKAEWENVKKLYQFQWIQRWSWLMAMAVVAVIGLIGTIIDRLFYKPSSWYLMIGSGNSFGAYAFIILIIMCIFGANILTAPNLTMYPGTVRTRFISRILFDYSLLCSGAVCFMAAHLLGMGVTKIIAKAGGPIWEYVMFDWKTFLMRGTLCLAYFILVYNFFILLYCLAVKAGPKYSLTGLAVIMVTGGVLLYKGVLLKILVKLWGFYMEKDMGYTAALVRVLGSAAVFLLLAYCIVMLIHSWREDMKGIIGFALVMMYVFSIMGIMLKSGDGTSEMVNIESGCGNLEQDIKDGMAITSDRIIHAGKLDGNKVNFNKNNAGEFYDDLDDLVCTIGWIELEEAKENHLVPKDLQVASENVYVRIIADNSKYKDKYMYQGIIDNIQVDFVDGECRLKLGSKAVVYDKFLTAFDSVLGKNATTVQWSSMSEDVMSSVLQQCQIYICYHKEDMINAQAIQNYFFDTSLPWYGAIEEEE